MKNNKLIFIVIIVKNAVLQRKIEGVAKTIGYFNE